MAYQSQNITTMGAIPAHVAAFAAAQGWTVAAQVYTHPSLAGAISATLSNPTSTSLKFAPNEAGAPSAEIEAPILNSGVQVPTKLHMFISQTPQPYIALCVEFGFNLYRHLYFGYMEKVSAYNGGEVVGASNHESYASNAGVRSFFEIQNQYLFKGHTNRFPLDRCGGVRVSHVNNAALWRKFRETNGNLGSPTEFLDTVAFGGYGDGINDGFVAHGKSPFLGANILAPINLYAPRFPGSNPHFVSLGRPAGVRMVNVKDIEPGAQILVSGNNWRVFPAHTKTAATASLYGPGAYPLSETSHYVGYAYPET